MLALKSLRILSLVLILGSVFSKAHALKDSERPLKASEGINKGVPTSWELSGVMAARSKQRSWTAQIHWLQQGPSSYQIRLFGPLGSGTVLIERQGGVITFRDGPKSVTAKNADDLLQRQTGVRLPVGDLYYWVRGIPAPQGAFKKKGAAHQLSRLQQAGFTIEYPGYMQSGLLVLPRIIKLQGKGITVKLVVKRWKAN